MSSNSPGPSQSSSNSASDFSSLPRGLLCRKGVPVARGARLPSLRSPRDLTLGGATKRTFTPNVNARREKKDDSAKTSSGPATPADRGRGSRRNQQFSGERGRGRGRSNNVIQLQGAVFGEGIAIEPGKKRASHGQSQREDSSSSSVPIPKYTPNNKMQTKQEKEQEEAKISELLRDDFLEDLEDDVSKLKPVQLPLLTKEVKKEIKVETDVKPNLIKVKKERLSDEEPEPMDVDGDVKPKLKKDIKTEVDDTAEHTTTATASPSVSTIFTNTNIPESGQLLFFQFPDCLPGASAKSDDDPRIKKEPGTSSSSSSTRQQTDDNGSCILSDLPEGCIGKLQILKSGKTRLLMGPVSLNVELGTPLGFLQELVSVHINQDRDPPSGDMYVLGHVQEKLVCLPDMDALLKNLKNL